MSAVDAQLPVGDYNCVMAYLILIWLCICLTPPAVVQASSALMTQSAAGDVAQVTANSTSGLRLYVQLVVQSARKPTLEQLEGHTNGANNFESTLESIVLQELNGDWKRSRQILNLLNGTRSNLLKQGVYRALWHELQRSKLRYNPQTVGDFYAQASAQDYLEHDFKLAIRQTFIARSADILAAPFYATPPAEFPLVARLLLYVTQLHDDAIFDELMSIVYDVVLLLEQPDDVLRRLDNFATNSTELLVRVCMQLAKRIEITNSTNAQQLLAQQLDGLAARDDFEQLPRNVRAAVLAFLPPGIRSLSSGKRVCLRNATHEDSYVYECPQTYLLCSNDHDPKKAGYTVQRSSDGLATAAFSFRNAFWQNRYMHLAVNETSGSSAGNAIVKNVYSRPESTWLHVRFIGDLVAIFDASDSHVLCGGNPLYWDGDERHVYTRSASDFEMYRDECTWRLEDC